MLMIYNPWRNVALLCVRGVRKIFSTSDDAKRVRERSFLNEPQASFEKIFRGRVWHHHELEISFGRQEHTVISLLFTLFANLTRKIVKWYGEIIIALCNNGKSLLHCAIMIIIVQYNNDFAIFCLTSFFERELLYNFLLNKFANNKQ